MPLPATEPASDRADAARTLPPRIVFYDGLCVFCNRAARWILAHDGSRRFYFAPLQGETAERLRGQWPGGLTTDLDSVVMLEWNANGEPLFHQRADALRAILRELEGILPALLRPLLGLLPDAVVNVTYDAFARRRLQIFGRLDACPLPPAGAADTRSLP